jgi:hypothetical protein
VTVPSASSPHAGGDESTRALTACPQCRSTDVRVRLVGSAALASVVCQCRVCPGRYQLLIEPDEALRVVEDVAGDDAHG